MKPHIIKTILLIVAIYTITAGPSSAWTVNPTFEAGTIGQVATGTSGFSYAGSATLYSDGVVHSGSKSASADWLVASTGWNIAHAEIDIPTITEGQEVWWRIYTYYEPGWVWSTSENAFSKLIRFQVSTQTNVHLGYLSIILGDGGKVLLSNELANGGNGTQPYIGVNLTTGTWKCVEMYVKFSASDPIIRIWVDGVLEAEDTTNDVMANSTDRIAFTTMMGVWNGGAPATQRQYLDDIVITTDQPSNTDVFGNRMVGPTEWSSARRLFRNVRVGEVEP